MRHARNRGRRLEAGTVEQWENEGDAIAKCCYSLPLIFLLFQTSCNQAHHLRLLVGNSSVGENEPRQTGNKEATSALECCSSPSAACRLHVAAPPAGASDAINAHFRPHLCKHIQTHTHPKTVAYLDESQPSQQARKWIQATFHTHFGMYGRMYRECNDL